MDVYSGTGFERLTRGMYLCRSGHVRFLGKEINDLTHNEAREALHQALWKLRLLENNAPTPPTADKPSKGQ